MNHPTSVIRSGYQIKRLLFTILFMSFVLLGSGVFAVASGGHDPKGWVATDTYRVFNFMVLAIGLFFVLRKPVVGALESRIQDIKAKLMDLEAKKEGVDFELAKYKEKFAQLDKESELILSEYIKQGEEAKDKIFAEAKDISERLKIQAKKNIEREFELARMELKGEVVDMALAKAEDIIKQQIGSGDQERLVDEYLKRVVA